jgi:hypothetical protein
MEFGGRQGNSLALLMPVTSTDHKSGWHLSSALMKVVGTLFV